LSFSVRLAGSGSARRTLAAFQGSIAPRQRRRRRRYRWRGRSRGTRGAPVVAHGGSLGSGVGSRFPARLAAAPLRSSRRSDECMPAAYVARRALVIPAQRAGPGRRSGQRRDGPAGGHQRSGRPAPWRRWPMARSIARAVRGASGMVTTLPPLPDDHQGPVSPLDTQGLDVGRRPLRRPAGPLSASGEISACSAGRAADRVVVVIGHLRVRAETGGPGPAEAPAK